MRSRIQDYLDKEGITQSEFARAVGVSPASICHYISGRRVPRKNIIKRIKRVTKGLIDANVFYG